MKKNSVKMVTIVLIFCLSIISLAGCTKKTMVKEGASITGEESVVREQAGAGIFQKEDQPPVQERAVKSQMQVIKKEELKEKDLPKGTFITQIEKEQPVKEQMPKVEVAKITPSEEPSKEIVPETKKELLLLDINFDFDKYDLKPDSRVLLEKYADLLRKSENYMLLVEGHCDERGTTEYNLALGQRRAEEAMKYIVNLGINEKRIKTVSYGEELPLDPDHNEEAWAKNRRDHFLVTEKK